MLVHEDEPYDAEPPRRALAGHDVTSIDAVYNRNHGPVPDIDPDAWTLRIDGMVSRPATLSIGELRRIDEHTEIATLRPESLAQVWNPEGYVNNSWARVRLHGVLSTEREVTA